jgi:hypothetical protein
MCLFILALPAFAAGPGEDFFESKVRPVLIKNCYTCHTVLESSGLRLDSREAMVKGGRRGPAIVPGKPEESLLVQAIHYQEGGLRMPPPGALALDEIQAIEQWIRDGAVWPDTAPATPVRVITDKERAFWSFQKPKKATPAVKNTAWVHNEIDRFIMAKLEEKKLTPSRDADKRTLIRRATLDLTGLPPTPAEIQGFLADTSSQAYEHLIDRLLASRAYAERWGRMWLDVVRYADTSGSGADYPIPEAHKYREWVIDATHQDMPYNEFIRQQIAGDLLPSSSEIDHWNKTIATGYLAMARRSGRSDEVVADAVDNLGFAYLGLSVACARCHDHKFDPIPTRDYYAIFGILNSTRFPEPGSEPIRYQRDLVYRDPTVTEKPEYLDFEAQLKPVADAIAAVNRLPFIDDVLPLLQERRKELFKKAPQFEAAYAVAEAKAGNARILQYGDPNAPAEEVQRGFLQILGGQALRKDSRGSGRLQLAEWIADSENPLTARVAVNRIWQGHFGRGLVATPNDFGSRGAPPSNLELLDYLATRFVETGWSMKAMHREILLSHTYRLSTESVPQNETVDADNVYLWRHSRQRLDAEQIRDSLLAIAGKLDRSPGGPHPFPPPYQWDYSQHVPFAEVYETNRRSVYLMVQRIRQHPYLGLFDGPDPNASSGQRSANTTSLQALYFMNGELPRICAESFTAAITDDSTTSPQFDRIFLTVLGRLPTPEERDRAQAFLTKAASVYKAKGDQIPVARQKSLAGFVESLFASNEFLFLD